MRQEEYEACAQIGFGSDAGRIGRPVQRLPHHPFSLARHLLLHERDLIEAILQAQMDDAVRVVVCPPLELPICLR